MESTKQLTEPKQKLFTRDFTLVVIGQIISLFGNTIIRFALPLYLLNCTHSAWLFGAVSALSFIPMLILSPIGGIIADRVNKRNVMVILDFSTAALTIIFSILLGKLDLVILIVSMLIILYAIYGTYQPSVQASIPALCAPENLMSANSVVNLVNSLAEFTGPVVGGSIYGFFGIRPILYVSIICFALSATMEIFIHIPFEKQKSSGSIFAIAAGDMKESFGFIIKDQPIIFKIGLIVMAINLVMTSLFMIGMPVLITEKLGFSQVFGNELYSFCGGAMAAGGLVGGVLSGVLSKKLKVNKSYKFLFVCAFMILPLDFALFFKLPSMLTYVIIIATGFITMVASTIFSIEVIAYIQLITPKTLIGKIMALATCFAMLATPVGQAIYGWLFDALSQQLYLIFFVATIISLALAFISKPAFIKLKKDEK